MAKAGLKEGVLTITAVAEGETSIKVSVSDGKGGTVQTEIRIIVSEIVDKSGLEALVEEAEEKEADLDRYVDGEAKDRFIAALEKAYGILSSETDEETVREAEETLKEAMQALREKAEKAELKKAIEKAESIDLKQYTEESAKAFTNVLKAAKEMYLDTALSVEEQAEVDQMTRKLLDAISGLEEEPDVPGGGTGASDGAETYSPSEGSGTDAPARAVQTGDTFSWNMAVTAFAAAIAAVMTLIWRKRRKY